MVPVSLPVSEEISNLGQAHGSGKAKLGSPSRTSLPLVLVEKRYPHPTDVYVPMNESEKLAP